MTDDPADILAAIAPEVADDDSAPVHLALAEKQTGTVYRDLRAYAVALLAAHTLTIAQRQGTGGRLSSVTEGQLSQSFNVVGFDGELSTTSHGLELLRLRRQYVFNARTVLV